MNLFCFTLVRSISFEQLCDAQICVTYRQECSIVNMLSLNMFLTLLVLVVMCCKFSLGK